MIQNPSFSRLIRGLLLAAGAACCAALPAAAADVGRVVSLTGSARAEGPAGSHALACGDTVQAGERLVLADGARVGVLSDAVYAQIESGSAVRAGLTDAGLPDWSLENGRIRVVDTRGSDATGRSRLSTPHLAASGLASDSEVYVLAEKAGGYSMACEWGEPLQVTRAGEEITAAPGECAVAKADEPLYKATAQEERIPLAGGDACDLGSLAGLGAGTSLASRFGDPLPAVAAGLSGVSLVALGPPATPAFGRQPCDNPGSGCMGGIGSAVIPNGGIGVVETPAGSGSLPTIVP